MRSIAGMLVARTPQHTHTHTVTRKPRDERPARETHAPTRSVSRRPRPCVALSPRRLRRPAPRSPRTARAPRPACRTPSHTSRHLCGERERERERENPRRGARFPGRSIVPTRSSAGLRAGISRSTGPYVHSLESLEHLVSDTLSKTPSQT